MSICFEQHAPQRNCPERIPERQENSIWSHVHYRVEWHLSHPLKILGPQHPLAVSQHSGGR